MPAGMSYAEVFNAMAPVVEQTRGTLWMRQLTLGPAREFCLHTSARVALPPAFGALHVDLRPIWPAR